MFGSRVTSMLAKKEVRRAAETTSSLLASGAYTLPRTLNPFVTDNPTEKEFTLGTITPKHLKTRVFMLTAKLVVEPVQLFDTARHILRLPLDKGFKPVFVATAGQTSASTAEGMENPITDNSSWLSGSGNIEHPARLNASAVGKSLLPTISRARKFPITSDVSPPSRFDVMYISRSAKLSKVTMLRKYEDRSVALPIDFAIEWRYNGFHSV